MKNEIFIHEGKAYLGSLSDHLIKYKHEKGAKVIAYASSGVIHEPDSYTFEDFLREKGTLFKAENQRKNAHPF